MSMADDYDYYEPDETEFNGFHYKSILKEYLKGKLFWKTRDGKKILIKDMELSHIENTIKVLTKNKNNNNAIKEWIDIFEIEINKRKETK